MGTNGIRSKRNGETMRTILCCPHNPRHTLSADREPRSYYCYQCAEHYINPPEVEDDDA